MKSHQYYLTCVLSFFSYTILAQPPEIDPLKAGITVKKCDRVNSKHLEFSPAYYYDGLVFVSSQNDEAKEDGEIDENFFELYYAGIDSDGLPTSPMYFSPNLNSRLHEGPLSFSPDFQTIYFTRNNMINGEMVKDRDGDINLQIFQAKKGVKEWEDIQPLSFNEPGYNYAHPSLSPDGTKLYFSSNMSGGEGGMDLYVVEKLEDGSWGNPQNLGSDVNTSGNDIFPYIHHTDILFFSSDGREGHGGLDLYTVNMSQSKKEVKNLGEPFNSIEDDLGILVSKDGKTGYFSSARFGGKGKDDMYYFNAPNGVIPIYDFNLAITVSDAVTGELIEGADIYALEGSADGYLEDSELYDLELVPAGEKGELTLKMVRKPAGQMGEPDATTIRNGTAFVELESNQHYIIYVEKEGYAPKDRAYNTFKNATFDEITIMLDPQDCIKMDGTVLNEETGSGVPSAVIKIETECNSEPIFIYSNLDGNFSYCLPRKCNYTLTATKEGFKEGMAVVTTKGNATPLHPVIFMQQLEDNWANEPVRKGSIIILDKIYYDFDKSYIRKGAARDLDALVALMEKYPSMEVEMVAHTDSRGTNEYNLELSLRRARSAVDYVTGKGIDRDRINAYGAGEKYPRNNCTDGVACTELQHQYNRRTEIKVMEIDEPVTLNYIDNGPEVVDKMK